MLGLALVVCVPAVGRAGGDPPKTDIPLSELKRYESGGTKRRKPAAKKQPPAQPVSKAPASKQTTPAAAADKKVVKPGVYDQALSAYQRNEYAAAVALFDRFLAENPSSPLAAEASLYKAECYLKQSRQ